MTQKKVLLRERDFHAARINMLQELTGHIADDGVAPKTEPAGDLQDRTTSAARRPVNATQFLAFALGR